MRSKLLVDRRPFFLGLGDDFISNNCQRTAAVLTFTGIISKEGIYGAFAALPFFLLWIYVIRLIVLTGSIFVKVLSSPKYNFILLGDRK